MTQLLGALRGKDVEQLNCALSLNDIELDVELVV